MNAHQHPAPAIPAWLRDMLPSDIRRYRIDVGGRLMHVMERGEGRPVLMIHGNPSWGFLYRKVIDRLTDEPLRVVVPDLIGLGFSDKPTDAREHTLDAHIGWMRALIEALELRDVLLVVQDWGGCVGAGAFAELPERLTGLVVLNTVLSPPKADFKATLVHRLSQLPVVSELVFREAGLAEKLMWTVQGDRRSVRGAVARAYRYPLRKRRDRVGPLALARMTPNNFDHPSIEPMRRCQKLIESYRGPAAIVWGDKDPVLGSVRSWIQKLLPQASVTRTAAGHFLQEEVPDEIADAIREVAAAR